MGNNLITFRPGRFSVVTKQLTPFEIKERYPQFDYDKTDITAKMSLFEVVQTSGHEDDDEYKLGDICLAGAFFGYKIILGKKDYLVFDVENIVGKLEENSYDD